jgi:molybdopterin converting factor small subunit
VRQVIDNLELEYPGIGARLMDDDRLRPSISVMVDGVISQEKLRHKLDESSEVHFIPAISGGMGQKR